MGGIVILSEAKDLLFAIRGSRLAPRDLERSADGVKEFPI